ncbi:hypothetical protein [Natronococcus wangiae]|nr:hypothetical protein [Natronococcus sp. AD5]
MGLLRVFFFSDNEIFAGVGVLDPDTQADVKDDVERLSQGPLSRLDDEL